MKRACIAVAWDRWRDRYCDERLRPIVRLPARLDGFILTSFAQEYQVLIQSHKDMLCHAFATWRSKTKVCLICIDLLRKNNLNCRSLCLRSVSTPSGPRLDTGRSGAMRYPERCEPRTPAQ
jgi:hypothetical protein